MSGSNRASASASISAEQLARGLGVNPEELREYVALKQSGRLPELSGAVWQPPAVRQHRQVPAVSVIGVTGPPSVSCLLVVGQAERVRLARQAVECFMLQTWSNKQLIIANGTDISVTTRSHPWIEEYVVVPGLSVGAMRNSALEHASGSWVMQWDDDDWSHPLRIAYQMGHRHDEAGHPVLLRYQIRLDTEGGVAFVHDDPCGIPGTLLFRRRPALVYPDQTGGEDVIFRVDHWGEDRVVVGNDGPFPSASMSIAFCHKRNVTPRTVFLGDRASPEHRGKWSMSPADADYLRSVLLRYGLSADRALLARTAPVETPPPLAANDAKTAIDANNAA